MKPLTTLSDLVFLKGVGILTDKEIFAEAFAYENKHRDFSLCHGCGARAGEQHQLECSRASILVLPDWYEELRRLDEDRLIADDYEFLYFAGIADSREEY